MSYYRNAYFSHVLFDGDGHGDHPGVIYYDDNDDLVVIAPVSPRHVNKAVLNGDDIVAVVETGAALLDHEGIAAICAALIEVTSALEQKPTGLDQLSAALSAWLPKESQ